MSHSGGKITGYVTIDDIRTVLNDPSYSLYSLCRSQNINIWSKYKPVKLNNDHTMDQWDSVRNKWANNATWFHGTTGCFSLTPYQTNSFSDLMSHTTGGMNGWTYERPEGNATYRCRQVDFKEYYHNAQPMCSDFTVAPSIVESLGELQVGASFMLGGDDNVSLEEIGVSMYFGFAFTLNGNVVFFGTAEEPNNGYIRIPSIPLSSQGTTYTVYPFLCNHYLEPTFGSDMGQNTYWTIPNLTTTTCTVASGGGSVGINAYAKWANTAHTKITVVVSNGFVSNYNISIRIRRTGRDWVESPYNPDEKNYDNQTLPGNQETTFANLDGGSADYNYHVMIIYNGVKRNDVGVFEEFNPD